MEMIDKLRQMILEELMIGQDELLKDDEELLLSGRIDSLGIVRLIALIEEDFKFIFHLKMSLSKIL
jgi:acyl carrier protein